MSDKLVTSSQSDSVRNMAIDKGVSRQQFQQALDNGSFSRFLDSLKLELKDIQPPKGARVRVLTVKVNQEREWQEAIDAASTKTMVYHNVRKIGRQYPPVEMGTIEQEIILLNFPNGGGNWDKALRWAKSKGLNRTNPREVFAIGEHNPALHTKLGQNPMYVVATTDCTFESNRYACSVWWYDSQRETDLCLAESFIGIFNWFAFRK